MTTTPVDPIVELFVDGQWVDVTPDCRQGSASSGGGFEITRGVPNEGNFAEPTQFNFVLNNGVSKVKPGQVGIYSPTNPLGPWFGKLGRNQRVRIGIDRRLETFARDKGPNSIQKLDGTFDAVADPISQWNSPVNGTFVRSTIAGYRGTYGGRLVTVGTPTQAYVRPSNAWIPSVVPGVAYRVSAMVMAPVTAATYALSIDWLDSSFGYLSTSSPGAGTLQAGVWTQLEYTATAPAGAAYATYGPTIGPNPPNTRTLNFDDLDFQVASGSGWGSLPDRLHADGTSVVKGETYWYYGDSGAFTAASGLGRIKGTGLNAAIIPKQYADVDVKMRFRWDVDATSEVGIFARTNGLLMPLPDACNSQNATNWGTASQGAIFTDTTVKRGSQPSSIRLDVVANGATTISVSQAVTATTLTPTYDGVNSNYHASAWLRVNRAGVNTRVGISWYSKDLVFCGSQTAETVIPTANVWYNIRGVFSTPPQDAYYARMFVGYATGSTPVIGDQMWISDITLVDNAGGKWYSTSVVPGSSILKIGKVSDGTTLTRSVTNPITPTVGTWYWMRVQMTGQRIRTKVWQDGTDEPYWPLRYFDDRMVTQDQVGRTGEIGVFINGGTSELVVDTIQVDQWRAHTEITQLPARFDLSRSDFWVPVQSRGILRRMNQGRKALRSPMSLHLEEYTPLSGGWWSLEDDEGDSAGNRVAGGLPGVISGLTFGEPDTTGTAALPGASGVATLDNDTSVINLSIKNHVSNGGKESFLWFMRLPNLPSAEILLCTIYSTGTVRTWYVYIGNTGSLRVVGKDRNAITIVDNTVAMWGTNADLPVGCWIACNLYILQNGSNVDWALNHHRPGSEIFWTNNGSYAGSPGIYTGANFRSSAVHTAAGNLQLTQIMHYAGDLPFVDYDFRRAAIAYDGEEAAARVLRLGANAGVPITTTGISTASVVMGIQTPSKLTELLEECATADDGFIAEERDDFGLTFVTRNSMWNRDPLTLDIDAGHLTAPLEPDTDDQRVRNDVTVSRPGGSFRRAIQVSGPLNVNEPEVDDNGVGTYDEQATINVGTDDLCGSHANWRVSRGTQTDPRYPSFTVPLNATAFQQSPVLAAEVLSLDPGDAVTLVNTETDYAPRRQQIASYSENIRDLYDWTIVYTAAPADVRRVGAVNYTTRIGTDGDITTTAPFTVGTDTLLPVTAATGPGFVTLLANDDRHWPFEIEVEGVRLRVTMTGNLINPADPGFEKQGLPDWEPSSANLTLIRDLYSPKAGAHSGRATATAAGTDGPQTKGILPVTASTNYLVSGWFKTEVAATDIRICVDWYTAGAYTTSGLPTPVTTSANVWTWYSAVVTSPAGVDGVKIRGRNVYASGYRAWYDGLRIVQESTYNNPAAQTLYVEQTPTNVNYGVVGKVIPAGSVVRVVDAMRVGWGEST